MTMYLWSGPFFTFKCENVPNGPRDWPLVHGLLQNLCADYYVFGK